MSVICESGCEHFCRRPAARLARSQGRGPRTDIDAFVRGSGLAQTFLAHVIQVPAFMWVFLILFRVRCVDDNGCVKLLRDFRRQRLVDERQSRQRGRRWDEAVIILRSLCVSHLMIA